MSFLDDLKDYGRAAGSWLSGNSFTSSLVKVAVTGYILNRLAKKDPDPDPGKRVQLAPSAENKIPVLYGAGFINGIITDAQMTNNNKTMYFCITLSEKTGTLLSSGAGSDFTFKDVYWNGNRIIFENDGITAQRTIDRNGQYDLNIKGLVRVWCFKGSSDTPATIENYTSPNTNLAYNLMPNWSSATHKMNDLVFAIVRVDYNKDKNITALGEMTFHVDNTMKLPGDCLNDYMTNTRYGAGIDPTEIAVQ
jgi:hypothetical protein